MHPRRDWLMRFEQGEGPPPIPIGVKLLRPATAVAFDAIAVNGSLRTEREQSWNEQARFAPLAGGRSAAR